MSECKMCDLCITRKNVVKGSGDKQADIMLIGEAPGYYEDKLGVPFIGKSGKYLRELIRESGFNDDDLFITNVVKCRPPNNREPDSAEIETCVKYFLSKEVPYVNPVFIITVGGTATKLILNVNKPMKDVVGRTFRAKDRWVIPIYHPSYILQNDELKDMYSKLIHFVFRRIRNISYDNAFEIAANYNKDKQVPF